jgi:hypothetical protein
MPVKRLVLFLLLTCWAAFGAAPQWVKTVCNYSQWFNSTTVSCTGTVTNSGDFIVVHSGNGGGYSVTSVIETGNANGYVTSNVECNNGSRHYAQWVGFASASGSRTFTVTISTITAYSAIIVAEYSGVPTSSYLDPGASSNFCAAQASGNPPFESHTTVTTTRTNELIVCGASAANAADPFLAGSGYGNVSSVGGGVSDPNVGEEDRTTTTAGAYGTTMGYSGGGGWVGGCASYNSIPVFDYSVSGPSSGYVHAASTIFTITDLTSDWATTPKTITVSDGGNSGTVTLVTCTGTGSGTTPAALSLTGGTTCTFTYTPSATGSLTLTSTINSGSDPNPNTYNYASGAWTMAFSGCSGGNLRVASGTCTLTLTGGTFDGTHTVTLSDGGNLGTFTDGSSGNPLTVTPTAASFSFTFTYTPYLVGNRIMTARSSLAYIQTQTQSYAVTRSDPCTMTANASGNWTGSIWTATGGSCGSRPNGPDTGDTVAITAFHVTVPIGTTTYMGTCPANNTTYDLTIASSGGTSGWLEVAGTLWLGGNVKLNSPSAAAPAIFQMDTGASLKWDMNNSSVAYRLIPGTSAYWNQLIIGTLGDTCTFGSESCPTNVLPVNMGSANPILVDVNATTDNITEQIYGTLIKNCGSTSVGCVNWATSGTAGSYANAGLVDIEGSIFDTTGAFQIPTAGVLWSPVASFTFKENRFLNDLESNFLVPVANSGGIGSGSSKPCSFTDNYFSSVFGAANTAYAGCTFIGNVFTQAFTVTSPISTAMATAAFRENVLLVQGNDYGFGTLYPLPIQRNYFAWQVAGASIHGFLLTTAFTQVYAGNVHESLDSAQGEGHCVTFNVGSPSISVILLDNLSLAAPNGVNSCSIGGSMGLNGGGTAQVFYTDHDGAFGTGVYQWFNMHAHSGNFWVTNQVIRSLRANIGYAASANAYNLMVGPNAAGTAVLNAVPNTVAYVAQEGNNALWNAADSTDWGPGNGNSGCNSTQSGAYGTPYDQCTASGTTVPGIPDIVANPKLLDPSRKLFTWASRLHGKTANLAGAEAAFIGCQNLDWCVSELVNWVRRGYQPTNLALKGKAYDGRIVGFTGTYGSGYTGTCSVTISPQDTDDLGTGAAATCLFVGGVPAIQVTNPGMHYRIATPATVTIGGTCTGGCVAASLKPVISPHDIGPVQMVLIPGVM